MKKFIYAMLLCASTLSAQVYKSDLGNGQYRNPILYADYSDPDVIRIGKDYLLTSSSFNSVPGLQILHSRDLVNWSIISAALPYGLPGVEATNHEPQYGNCVWAPSIRYHNGYVYIFYGDPDRGIYWVRSAYAEPKDGAIPQFAWEEPVLVLPGKGYIDPCPYWEEDGRVFMSFALAGSRAGLKSVLLMTELAPDMSHALHPGRIFFDGHSDLGAAYDVDKGNYWDEGVNHPTCEGTKIYKRGEYYYLMHPAGGVPTGWQTVLRSKHIYGPYESKVVMAQGGSQINGPHQGGWVTTDTGEDWFIHFQDVGAYGRIALLEPMTWTTDGWPVIGVDKDGDGVGEPVAKYRKPTISGATEKPHGPQENDEFEGTEIGLQWQWAANPDATWAFCDAAHGWLRLYSVFADPKHKTAHQVPYPNLLLQKTPAENFTVTAKVRFMPCDKYTGDNAEKAGLIVTGMRSQEVLATPNGEWMYLRVRFEKKGMIDNTDQDIRCTFYSSTDGKHWQQQGQIMQAKEGKWIGAKVGLFCTRPLDGKNDGGWMDVDWVRFDK